MAKRKRTGGAKTSPPPPKDTTQIVQRAGDTSFEDIMPKSDKKKFFQSFWSSPEKMALKTEKQNRSQEWTNSGWQDDTSGWSGSKTMVECLRLAKEGWKDGTHKITRLLNRIQATHPLMKKPQKYGIAGSTPNVPRAIAGDPFNMRIPDLKKASRRPVLTLLSNMCANWSHDADEFINRAAVIAALIDQIEAAGYACDVITYAQTEGTGGLFYDGDEDFAARSCIQIKNSNQPVDLARLAFGLGHPAMFRRLVFAEWGGDKFNEDLGRGLGHVSDIKITKELAEKNIYVLPSVNGTSVFKTEKSAETEGVNLILRSLKEQGCPAFRDIELPPQEKKKELNADF